MNLHGNKSLTSSRAIWLFGSLALFTLSLTILYFGMRSVMELGGFCASGGPYQIRVECPQGIPGLMSVAPVAMILSMFAYMFSGGPIILLWSAVFTALGWNFVQFGLNPPQGGGVVWAWLMPAIMFMIMGLGPLLFMHPIRYITSLFQSETYTGGSTDLNQTKWVVLLIHVAGIALGVYGGIYLFGLFT